MLITRCPHCGTGFRVRPEQLSVRGGRVRCGHCQQPFSALAHLEEIPGDDVASVPQPAANQRPAAASAPAPAASVANAAPVVPTKPIVKPAVEPAPSVAAVQIAQAPVPLNSGWSASDGDKGGAFPPLEQPSLFKTEHLPPVADVAPASKAPAVSKPDQPAPVSVVSAAETGAPAAGDDFSMNVVFEDNKFSATTPASEDMDFDFSGLDGPDQAVVPPAPPLYESALGKALGVPAYDPARDLDFGQTVMLEEPIELMGMPHADNGPDSLFFERERQQSIPRVRVENIRKSGSAWPWAFGVLVMLLLATLQLSFVFRVELAQAVPQLRPDLERACAWLGCRVPYPQDAEMIALEGHSFNPEAGSEGRFRLVVTLLNKAPHQQAWPHLELTVTDRFDIAVVRRVLTPAEWLPAANATQPAFDGHSEITANLLLSINNLQAAGYRLYVFYP